MAGLFSFLGAAAPSASAQNLVLNPGFETGGLTDWTEYAAPNNTDFAVVSGNSHSGTYSAEFGAYFSQGNDFVGSSFDSISQNVPTTPGDIYTVSFWLNSDTGTPCEFQASWNGAIFYHTEDVSFGYTQETGLLEATATSTPIEFSGFQIPAYYYLDDVSVTFDEVAPPPVPEPATWVFLALTAGLLPVFCRRQSALPRPGR